jgi:hypothetical protein
MSYTPTNTPGYVIDESTKAVINIDSAEYERVRQQRARSKEMKNLGQRVENLERDISEIKEMLIKALSGR